MAQGATRSYMKELILDRKGVNHESFFKTGRVFKEKLAEYDTICRNPDSSIYDESSKRVILSEIFLGLKNRLNWTGDGNMLFIVTTPSYRELPLDYIENLFKFHKGRNCRNIHLAKSSIDIARYFMSCNTANAADPLRGRDESATIELLVINLALGAKLGLDLAEQTMNARGDSLDPAKHLKMLEEASGWKL